MKYFISILSFLSAIFYLINLIDDPTMGEVAAFIGSVSIFLTTLIGIRKDKNKSQIQRTGKSSTAVQSGRDSIVTINNKEE